MAREDMYTLIAFKGAVLPNHELGVLQCRYNVHQMVCRWAMEILVT